MLLILCWVWKFGACIILFFLGLPNTSVLWGWFVQKLIPDPKTLNWFSLQQTSSCWVGVILMEPSSIERLIVIRVSRNWPPGYITFLLQQTYDTLITMDGASLIPLLPWMVLYWYPFWYPSCMALELGPQGSMHTLHTPQYWILHRYGRSFVNKLTPITYL
jgi:hypothetical protein